MNIEPGRIINDFIEPNKRQYAIPVYQRNYEWSREECEKLFMDIVEAFKNDKNHFCGSVVYAQLKEEHNIHYYVIVDGQQRMTTIYLLLKALLDEAETESERDKFITPLFNKDNFDEYGIDTASKLKLKPIKTDNKQLMLLMENKHDEIDKSSGIWINYKIFRMLIRNTLSNNPNMDVKMIYNGIEKLTCAKIRLDENDNAQEIFERINSTGVPLSLADKIRNYVLMTDEDQDHLYEEYWLKVESLVTKKEMSDFFIDYLNLKTDGFSKEKEAYDAFKKLFVEKNYTNENILKEIVHYADLYNTFVNGNDKYSAIVNEYLKNLKQLKQTTVHLFLFRVFDDYLNGIIDQYELERILQFLVSYSVRRIMCEIPSNSLRGMYKTLYNRIFAKQENKKHYYDAIVSLLKQITSRDVIPTEDEFEYALKNNNLYNKHALCKFLLVAIENQGKEKLDTANLTIEHVMPQNKNLSDDWRDMLGKNWEFVRDKWLHTLGNLTLTGYNSELGDRKFSEKKSKIEEKKTKVVVLYEDIKNKQSWNADAISSRADRLIKEVFKLFPIEEPDMLIDFRDPSYSMYTAEEPSNATYKTPSYYELLGERVNVDNFAEMMRSVSWKLYDRDNKVIEEMAKKDECFDGWTNAAFSYNIDSVKGEEKLRDTEIYIASNYSARKCVEFIRRMLEKYELNVSEDFAYCAKENNKE